MNVIRANVTDFIKNFKRMWTFADVLLVRLPWVQPWGNVAGGADLGQPKNASTSRAYSRINILILWGGGV